MTNPARVLTVALKRNRLNLHHPSSVVPSSTNWLINGYPARVVTWTREEWASLDDRPVDAQQGPNGVWCALRMA